MKDKKQTNPVESKEKHKKGNKSVLSNVLEIMPTDQLSTTTNKIIHFFKKKIPSVPKMITHEESNLLPKLEEIEVLTSSNNIRAYALDIDTSM